MTATLLETKTHTAEAYLAREVNADTRSEYHDGEIVAMTGGTPTHNQLVSALNAWLWLHLNKQRYRVFVTDQRLWIPAANLYTYPDIMVTANPLELQPGRQDTVMNPLLVAEVLSKSTETSDRGRKFAAYRTLASLQTYLLIDQYSLQVEQYAKQTANQWLYTSYNTPEACLNFSSLGLEPELPLATLYETTGL